MLKPIPCIAALAVWTVGCGDATTDPISPRASQRAQTSLVAAVPTVVMSGLYRPLGLAIGPEGAVYVTEAGAGVVNGPCALVARGHNCVSGTGAISRLWQGKQERIASGLPSVYNPDVPDLFGPERISFQGRGGMYVTIGWGGDPAARAQLGPAGDVLGVLLKVTPNGAWQRVADISAFEQAYNPDGVRIPDSNPFGLLAEPGRQFVTDAGGNDLLEVAANGSVSLVATFPAIPITTSPFREIFGASQAVPTQVRRGPDGALYVSELTGAPFLPGVAGIYRVVAGQTPQLYAGGFTQITDFDWGSDGSMYVLQIGSAPFFGGVPALIRVRPDGTRSTVTTALTSPSALAISADGAIYIAQKVFTPGQGEVVRIVP